MAIDTAQKRRTVIDVSQIRGTGVPIPSGLIGVASRAHVLNLYFQIPVAGILFFWRNQRPPVSTWQKQVTPTDGSTQII